MNEQTTPAPGWDGTITRSDVAVYGAADDMRALVRARGLQQPQPRGGSVPECLDAILGQLSDLANYDESVPNAMMDMMHSCIDLTRLAGCYDESEDVANFVMDDAAKKSRRNVDKWGLQDDETLHLAMIEELGEIAQAHLQARHEDGDEKRIVAEIDDLAALCIQRLARWSEDQLDAAEPIQIGPEHDTLGLADWDTPGPACGED